MNIQQRLTRLEQTARPTKDIREPLLLTIIDTNPDTGEIVDVDGILYDYSKEPNTRHLTGQELKEYKLRRAI